MLDSPLFLIQHSNLDTLVDFFPCLVGDDYGPDLEHDVSNTENCHNNWNGPIDSNMGLIHLLFTEIFCTMGYRNFCSKASVQKFLCPIVQKNFCEK